MEAKKMKRFAAIDFETANWQPTSVCSVGIVVMNEREIEDQYYSLIRPEPNYYSGKIRRFMDCRGKIRMMRRRFLRCGGI